MQRSSTQAMGTISGSENKSAVSGGAPTGRHALPKKAVAEGPKGGAGRRGPPPSAPRRPPTKKQQRSRYYIASLVMAIVFVGMAIAFPVWLDHTRNRTDMKVFETDLSEIEGRPALPVAPDKTAVAPRSMQAPTGVNQECRSYVLARCNALMVEPRPCMEVVRSAMGVPVDGGMDGCKGVVDPMLMARASGVQGTQVDVAQDIEITDELGVLPGQPAVAGAGEKDDKGKEPERAQPPQRRLAPADEAGWMERMAQLVEEIQVAQNNYGVSTQIQTLRLQELRRLAAEVDTKEAKELFNMVNDRFAPKDPQRGGERATESKIVPSKDGLGEKTPAEIERARELENLARRRAGLEPRDHSTTSGGRVESVRPSSVQAASSSTVKATPASSVSAGSINSSKARAAVRP